MSSDLDSESKKLDDATGIEPAKLIWDEYKYRHEHVWKLIFQITVAVVVVSIIPYSQVHVGEKLRELVVVLPVIGLALTLIGLARLSGELRILEKVRARHRQLQRDLHGIEHGAEASQFSGQVKAYLVFIMLLEVANIIVLLCFWV